MEAGCLSAPVRCRACRSPGPVGGGAGLQRGGGDRGNARGARRGARGAGASYEILVVDNASADGTAERVEPLVDPRVRLLRNEVNRGKGFSVRRGMLEATRRAAPALRRRLRRVARVAAGTWWSRSRRPTSWSARGSPPAPTSGAASPCGAGSPGRTSSTLCRLVLGEPSRDLFCGFKLWRAGGGRRGLPRQRLDGWAFDAEVLALARRSGFRITEIGIVWTDREGSRLSMRGRSLPVIARARPRPPPRTAPGEAGRTTREALVPEPAKSRHPEPATS